MRASIRTLNRLECVGETRRPALNSLATLVPDWLRSVVPSQWDERYAHRIEDFRLPREASKRQAGAEQTGADGSVLLTAVYTSSAPAWLREVPAVERLRRVWVQQFTLLEGKLLWRSDDNIPPASVLISSPYDPDAHLSIKRSTVWTDYPRPFHANLRCRQAACNHPCGNHPCHYPRYRDDQLRPPGPGCQAALTSRACHGHRVCGRRPSGEQSAYLWSGPTWSSHQ